MANETKPNVKRAIAKRTGHFEHLVEVGDHRIVTDEPVGMGGKNAGPSPQELLAASLASCTATTIEMYASHKGWEVGGVKVKCEFESAKRGTPTTFNVVVCVPPGLDEEQTRRVMEIAAKCPVHRTLEGEVIFNETMIVQ